MLQSCVSLYLFKFLVNINFCCLSFPDNPERETPPTSPPAHVKLLEAKGYTLQCCHGSSLTNSDTTGNWYLEVWNFKLKSGKSNLEILNWKHHTWADKLSLELTGMEMFYKLHFNISIFPKIFQKIFQQKNLSKNLLIKLETT